MSRRRPWLPDPAFRGPDLKPRKPRPAPVRDGLRPSRATPRSLRRARSTAKALAAGICSKCLKQPLATMLYCRPCANRHAAIQRQLRRRYHFQSPPPQKPITGTTHPPDSE